MLIGGFQHIDMEKALRATEPAPLRLPCDPNGRYGNQVYTNNGRTATIYLLQNCLHMGPGDVLLLPDYLCLSVLVTTDPCGCACRFYRVNPDLSIDLADLRSKMDSSVRCVYLIHYFGKPHTAETARALLEIREEYGVPIVEDLTQALFSEGEGCIGYADYIVSSTRKWFPNTDGGVVAARDGAAMPHDALGDPYNEAAYKQLLISLIRDYYDKTPGLDYGEYLALEAEANRVRYTDLTVRGMTPFSLRVMCNTDIAWMVERRRDNYRYLYAQLSGIEGLRIGSAALGETDVWTPFGLLLMTDRRDAFYRYLVSRGLIGEIQWVLPLERYTPGEAAMTLSGQNLMIHCDQRYTRTDMAVAAGIIKDFFTGDGAPGKTDT